MRIFVFGLSSGMYLSVHCVENAKTGDYSVIK